MAEPVRVEWQGYHGSREEREADSPDDAEAVFRSVDDDGSIGPVLVEFFLQDGPSLSVGAGRDGVSVLNYQGSVDPPYFTSIGNASDRDVDYSYGGDFSEYRAANVITKADAIAALREFVVTRRRPSNVGWEQL